MNAPVAVIITAHTAQYQSLPRTVMWLLVETVFVKPFACNAPLPIFTVFLCQAGRTWGNEVFEQGRPWEDEDGADDRGEKMYK